MAVLVDLLLAFLTPWPRLVLLVMVTVYDTNLVFFNKPLKMVLNAKSLEIGMIISKKLKRDFTYEFLGYVMEIHGKYLDQSIKFQLTFTVVLFNRMENPNGLTQKLSWLCLMILLFQVLITTFVI